jgi:hypothetical protein
MSNWRTIQLLYMPGVSQLVNKDDEPDDITLVKLWFPSQVPNGTLMDSRLYQFEFKLRYAQAQDAPEDIRKFIWLCSYLTMYNRSNIRGQGANTRARNTLKGINDRIKRCSVRYRAAHAAVSSLSSFLGAIGCDRIFRVLKDEDLRPAEDLSASSSIPSEGRRQLSWIYMVGGLSESSNAETQDCGYTL